MNPRSRDPEDFRMRRPFWPFLKHVPVLPLLLLAWAPTSLAAQVGTESLALVGGRVLDGFGGPPLENAVILVEGDRIVALGPKGEMEIPRDATVISTEGMTVMPGLWDMHVHLQLLGHGDYPRWHELFGDRHQETMAIAAEQLLMAGVTSARDLGGPLEELLEVRRGIREGALPGPDLYISGPFIQRAPYQPYEERYRWGVNGPQDARGKVQHLVDAGVDVIKLIDQDLLSEEEVSAVMEAARAAGVPVVAHAHRMEEIRVGLRAGVQNFEHTGLGTAPAYPDDIMDGLKERNASLFWTPTASPLIVMHYTGEVFPERLDDPAWRAGMPEEMAEEIRQSLNDITRLPYYALFPSRIPRLETKFQQLRESGVQLLIGTDAGIPTMFHNDSTWREMELWVRWGVDPMQVIQAATLWPARFMGVESEVGALAPGLRADIIAVRGDPLTQMSILRSVDLVVKEGRVVKGAR